MKIANVVLNDFTRDNRVLKTSIALVEAGHEVTVVALHRNQLPRAEYHPAGFRIERVRIYIPGFRVLAPFKWAELVLRIAWVYRKADAWHCNDAEAFGIGLLAKWLRSSLDLVYDCHEFESERNGKPAWLNKAVRRMETRHIGKAEEVLVVSPSIQAAYESRYTEHGMRRISLVRNVPNARSGNAATQPLRENLGLKADDFVAIYQGALTINRGIETLLAMAPKLNGSRIHLVFMGYGMLEPQVMEAVRQNANVHFQPAVPYEEVLGYTGDADVGLVSVKPVCLSYLYCLPNKLFESIQAGIPVLVNDLPDCVALIERFGIGARVVNDTPEGWYEALAEAESKSPAWKVQAIDGMREAQAALNWENESHGLTAIYERLQLEP
jgi:glycosyltransferase involved in cell wall biosynthesis